MTPEERNLITGLFDRISASGAADKDRQADALIKDAVRQIPDAPYVLVQTVLVMENTLQQAEERIRDLEEQVASLEARLAQASPAPAARASSGFLGGALGRGSASGSVPSYSARPAAQSPAPAQAYQPAAARSPWGTASTAPAQQAPQPMAQPSGTGGFFRTAMTTAAGVAGGMMMAEGLKGMFGGGSHAASGDTHQAGSKEPQLEPDTQTALAPPAEDPVVDDAAYDYDSGGDDGSYDA